MEVSSDCQTSFFLSKIFGNEMCQTWCQQLENENLGALFGRDPLL